MPKDENYWDMLKLMCCPTCQFLSFTTFMILVYMGLFIAEAALGVNREGSLLQINHSVLIRLGANYSYAVRLGQVWRLITASLLHADFMHFLGNWVITIILLSRFEYTFGSLRCIVIYLGCSIGGNILAAICTPSDIKVGASACLFGLIGVTFGYIIVNWSGLNAIGPIMKCQLVCLSILITIFTIVFTSAGVQTVDYYGHVGGFFCGLWLSSINKTIKKGKCERNTRIIGLILFLVQLMASFAIFYSKKLSYFEDYSS